MVTADEIRKAAEMLRRGRLVAFPTETVYGLGANALDPLAVRRIYEAKGRPASSPVIVHVATVAMARRLAAEWPDEAERLAAKFWPGPMTIVVPKRPDIPDNVTAGLGTVGIRMPSHPVALELIRAAGVPVAAPSANKFAGLSPTTAAHVRESLGDSVSMILDGGACQVGIESTVVSVAGGHVVVLRPGMIPASEIEAVAGPLRRYQKQAGGDPAPGMKDRHYSPRTKLVFGVPESGRGVYLYVTEPAERVMSMAMPNDAAGYAAALYDTLHRLDSQGWDWIGVEPVPDTEEWAGVRDRLQRASVGADNPK
ncbi:MAG: threonylcarbamoyl-AMP synthase [Proteobacteria bacterium]|nr:threonylcarbamoyl-AMP synthase [Pseudomonadota bacterium]